MATFERIVNTFTRGELSPRITARVDFEGRFDGAEKLENFIVHVQGGAQKRSGTRFAAGAADDNNNIRLIPFEVSVEQNYIIEATPGKFRFYANSAQLQSGGLPVEVSTPWGSGALPNLKWTQSVDILFLTHPTVRTRELRRTSPTSFSIANFSFSDGPYLDINVSATTLTLSGTTGSVTVTASSTTGINDDQGFLADDVARLIRWRDPAGNWTWLEITAHTNSTTVTATIRGADASAGTATVQWRLGAWSETTGWPQVCVFHQSSLWFGRTTTQPQTLWASRAGAIRNFAPTAPDGTVTDGHAITLTIDSNQVNAIAWLISVQKGLQIGSVGEEWLVRSADNTTGISPLNAELVPQGSWGSDDTILPVRVGTSTLYTQRGSTVIRESAFDFDQDAFTAQNITILAEHLFRKGVSRIVFAQTPIQTVWALLDDGTLAGFTFDKEQKVLAWHHHTIAGTNVTVQDIAAMKAGTNDQIWMAVRRTVDGNQRQHVEFFEALFDEKLHSIDDAFFVDSGLSYSGVATVNISGLDHLEGETVTVLADGSVQPSKVVSSGAIVLDRAASEIHAGLAYSGEIVTLPLEAPQREGSFVTLGKTKRIHQVALLLAETVGIKIGPVGGKLDEIAFRAPSVPMGAPVPLFNGVKRLSLESSWGDTPRVRVVSDQPLPCTVLAIVSESEIHGS